MSGGIISTAGKIIFHFDPLKILEYTVFIEQYATVQHCTAPCFCTSVITAHLRIPPDGVTNSTLRLKTTTHRHSDDTISSGNVSVQLRVQLWKFDPFT
uniref:Uncharacterized protein n=1 Tax=Anguilla anguilla TaxID=7936 RepID=A0A0E9XLL7_ANGAN